MIPYKTIQLKALILNEFKSRDPGYAAAERLLEENPQIIVDILDTQTRYFKMVEAMPKGSSMKKLFDRKSQLRELIKLEVAAACKKLVPIHV